MHHPAPQDCLVSVCFRNGHVQSGSSSPETPRAQGDRGVNDLVAMEMELLIISRGHIEIICQVSCTRRLLINTEKMEGASLNHERTAGEASTGESSCQHCSVIIAMNNYGNVSITSFILRGNLPVSISQAFTLKKNLASSQRPLAVLAAVS